MSLTEQRRVGRSRTSRYEATVNDKEPTVELSALIDSLQEYSNHYGSNQSETDPEKELIEQRKYKKILIIRLLIRLIAISTIIIISTVLSLDPYQYLTLTLDYIYETFGKQWSPILFCGIFSLWTSISPMGYLPTVLCGIFFDIYIAPFVAYVSINIGSFINILFVRYIILKNKDRFCIRHTLKCVCGKKFGQLPFLKRIFMAESNPIKIIILLRLPYLHNGIINYLLSLQIDSLSIKQNIIGNFIGFVPGSILFSILGKQIKDIAKIISNEGFESTEQMIITISVAVMAVICYGFLIWKINSVIKSGTKRNDKGQTNDSDNANDCDENGTTYQQFSTVDDSEQYLI